MLGHVDSFAFVTFSCNTTNAFKMRLSESVLHCPFVRFIASRLQRWTHRILGKMLGRL